MNLEKTRENVARLLKERGETVGVAESSAGGYLSANLLAIPGASAYYAGGTVIYTKASRLAFLKLPMEKLKGLRPLSEEMTMVFAETIKDDLSATWGIAELGATWGIAELGVAGPGGAPYSKEVGITVIAIAGAKPLSVIIRTETDDREENMKRFTFEALSLLEKALLS